MIEFNLISEYSTLVTIIIILISVLKDFDAKTFTFRFLKVLYIVTFLSTLSTILATLMCQHTEIIFLGTNFTRNIYIFNTLYLIFIPVTTFGYLFYAVMLTNVETEKDIIEKKLAPIFIMYGIYLLIILISSFNGYIFYVNEEQYYTRGPIWFLPYIVSMINLVFILSIVFKNRQLINKNVYSVIVMNMIILIALMFLQLKFPEILLSGLLNTCCILSVHLYIQSDRKTIDSLTKIKNRNALRLRVITRIRKKEDFSLYVLSLRGFKAINERNGLDFGDKVLTQMARRLLKYVHYENVYRYSGDEFALVLDNTERSEKVVKTILRTFSEPFSKEYDEELCIDLVCARVDNKLFGNTDNELFSAIDYSISNLKQTSGEPKYLYDDTVVKKIVEKSDMVKQIKNAIEKRNFVVFYQPIYSTKKHCFSHAEALVRMTDEDGTIIPPYKFIDIAEETGLIVPMTYIILDIVCEDFRKLLDTYGENLFLKSISVNFPYEQFSSPNMQEKVVDILNKHKIDTNMIKIEITERTLISDATMVENHMKNMSEVGFVFELDDFGVDYSNMSTFLKLPLQIVKIDRSVLLSAMESKGNMGFFNNLVQGIRATERISIVEGIEDESHLNFVMSCACEYVQGYIFSKPLPFLDFKNFIKKEQQEEFLKEFSLSN